MHLYVAHNGRLLGHTRSADSRVHVAPDAETEIAWKQELARDRLPIDVGVAISNAGAAILWDEMEDESEDLPHYLGPRGQRFVRCATSFREFLNVWIFLDQDSGVVRTLGDVLWPGQEKWVEAAVAHAWIYFLKARQLGETTIGIAWDAWVLRFRQNSRVHLVSRTETLAKNSLLKPLKFGVRRLPEEMLLPEIAATTTTLELDAGADDRRIAVAYAAKEPGRGETCSHLHLDEWAAMMETSPELPADVWAAAEPTISKEGGTCHILTTGVGPEGFYADTWRSCVSGDGQLHACFIPATGSRPHYTKEWLAAKRRAISDDARFSHEYPEKWEDALAGRGDAYFTTYEVDWAARYARGLIPPIYDRDPLSHKILRTMPWGSYKDTVGRERKRLFVKAWDIGGPGEDSDASCGILLDVTEEVWDVRGFLYLKGISYPALAAHIEAFHWAYPGYTWIEDNNAGLAVRQFLRVSEDQVKGWKTTPQSKGPALRAVKVGLGLRLLKWIPEECPQLDVEMRGYKLDDKGIKQDTVMALAIATSVAPEASAGGGGKVIRLFDGGLAL